MKKKKPPTEELSTFVRLREVSDRLWRTHDLCSGLEQIIDAVLAQLGTDMGTIQLLHPTKKVLEIAAQQGFGADFLEHFREVSAAEDTACGRSLLTGERIFIEDLKADRDFAPHLQVALAAGYRSVLSTPLFGADGKPLGVFSTFFRKPHRPSEGELRRFDLYSNQAAEYIERVAAEQRFRGAGALIRVQEEANRQLARELHDDFSQELAVLAMDISALKASQNATGQLAKRLEELNTRVNQLVARMHDWSRRLHPSIVQELGLKMALQEECRLFSHYTGIPVRFSCEPPSTPLSEERALCLYRVLQESLRNVRKHTAARDVIVQLEAEQKGIRLRIEDIDGGFDVAKARRNGGLGIISMEERVHLVGGSFSIRSAPGVGTTVEVFLLINTETARSARS